LLALASIFREAIDVLDTVGWLSIEPARATEVAITPGHLAQLRRLHDDLAQAILERLDSRARLTDPDDIAEADAAIDADRLTAHGLLQLLQACGLEEYPALRLKLCLDVEVGEDRVVFGRQTMSSRAPVTPIGADIESVDRDAIVASSATEIVRQKY
jgi:hypothetical protein